MVDPIDCCSAPKTTSGRLHTPDCPYWCSQCGRRKEISCNCGEPFWKRVNSISIDRAALKRFHEGR